jgi:hypothetical protein
LWMIRKMSNPEEVKLELEENDVNSM